MKKTREFNRKVKDDIVNYLEGDDVWIEFNDKEPDEETEEIPDEETEEDLLEQLEN